MRLDIAELLTAEVREPDWVVEGIVPRGTIVLVAGDAGVGKSVKIGRASCRERV